jgi:predicted RNase H-like HicB family nuclease
MRVLRARLGRPDAETGGWDLQIRVDRDELDGGFVAECVNLPGCMSQGETVDQALENLSDAICGVLMVRLEDGVHRAEAAEDPSSDDEQGVRRFMINVA